MGGTFNPVHNAHLLVAEMAMEEYNLDRVIFMTGGDPPHKKKTIDAHHRFQMTHIAIKDSDSFIDDDFEIKSKEKSYTVKTLSYLKEKYPNDELFFIIGEDSLNDLPKWYKPEEILSMCNLLVFPRNKNGALTETLKKIKEQFNGNIFPISAPIVEFSSTNIRQRIRSGKTVKYMIPDAVIDYIKENHLYEE